MQNPTFMINNFYLFLILLFLSMRSFYTQEKRCSLQIYSEIDSYSLFIDDVLKGENIRRIDSLECGEHYVKITHQNVIVFSEIIQFESNQVKKILIRKNKELEEKLLSSKTKEIAEYKRRKISIGLNKKYITTTDVQLNQYTYKPLFGNYYGLNYSGSINGVQFSISEEKITDWFFIEGGYIKMTDADFIKNYCELTKNSTHYQNLQQIMKNIEKENERIEKNNKRKIMWTNIFLIMFAFGSLLSIFGFLELIIPLFINDTNIALNVLIVGLIMLLLGLIGMGIKPKSYKQLPEKLLSLKESLKMIDEYNSALKKQLNLPENID